MFSKHAIFARYNTQGQLEPVEEALLSASGLNYRERLKIWSIHKYATSIHSIVPGRVPQDLDLAEVEARLQDDMRWLLESLELINSQDYSW